MREVYFVQARTLRLVKIGVTNDIYRRLGSLQTFSPDPLDVLGVMICPQYGRLEQWLHVKFADARAHGEWFHPTDALMAFIRENVLDEQTATLTKLAETARRGAPGKHIRWAMPPSDAELRALSA